MTTNFPRASGILLHPTSLPGSYGIGDLGGEAFKFVDFLSDSRQTYWQILPLGPTGFGDSPYQCFSAFAGNTLIISPERLIEEGLLSKDDLGEIPRFPEDHVDFGAVYEWKTELLPKAFESFSQGAGLELRDAFAKFCSENQFWLDDYSLYRAVKASESRKPWYEWPEDLRLRDAEALRFASKRLSHQAEAEKFYQFLFFRQWAAVKSYANSNGVRIIGDIPIFVALDSSDVWCNQDKFKLNADGTAKVVAGVPPDYFSKTGQLWGNPIYDWDSMRRDHFAWWVARAYSTLQIVDIVRLDHFRGFAASWEVPGTDETAENGTWVEVPGRELFTALHRSLGRLPVIAEDLGFMTPDVEELRDEFNIPGMRILQFGFGGDARNRDLPHNYIRHSVAYTGTHDNDTAVGWFSSLETAAAEDANADAIRARDHCLEYLNSDGSSINWDLIRAVWASVADTAIVPMADILSIGSEGRMNVPSTVGGNWQWRMANGAITDRIQDRLRELTEIYGRSV